MTFSGACYESILDIERLVCIEGYRVKAIQIKLKYMQQSRDKEGIAETQSLLNLTTDFYNMLVDIEQEMIAKIEQTNRLLNDVEGDIFIRKFVKNQENTQIQNELFLSPAAVSKYCKAIKDKMINTEYGKEILETLKKEGN